MESLDQLKSRIEASVPGARATVIPNPGPANQPSLLINHQHARAVAQFLRDDPALKLDFCSNVTGVDWLERKVKQITKVMQLVGGVEKEVSQTAEATIPCYLESVYHLYSVELKHGPIVIRLRTADREIGARLPSLTPVWRSAEFQEREIYDLYGIHFEGHPDQRRILMWEEFQDHPMRKDYVAPDDFEYEPTPHDEVLARAKDHYAGRPEVDGGEELRAQ